MAFIDDLLYDRYLYSLRSIPIGLLNKSYDFTNLHLYRNIGNNDFVYDGFSTPIGSVSDPYYNIGQLPFFKRDVDRNSVSNYIEYAKNIYGATLSVENINENFKLKLDDKAKSVGFVEASILGDILLTSGGKSVSINPNGTDKDTLLGKKGAEFSSETLRNAIIDNDARDKNGFSISDKFRQSYGMKTTAINDGILKISSKLDEKTGRYNSLSPLTGSSPIDENNNGTLGSVDYIKDYSDFYESLSVISKAYLDGHLNLNKYHPKTNSNENISNVFNSYFEVVKMDANSESMLGSSSHMRYIFEHNSSASRHRNVKDSVLGDVYVYSENENGSTGNYTSSSFNGGIRFGRYSSYGNLLTADDLLKKTNDSFRNAKYDTIIARFHTSFKDDMKTDTTQTAISTKYGMSHGRNLLKKTPDKSQGYDNPYCRVWTHHHQYHRLADALRPMEEWGASGETMFKDEDFSANHGNKWGDGRTRLSTYGVLNNENGLVNITPSKGGSKHKDVDIKNCMFSIENLAWKDSTVKAGEGMEGSLSKEQVGPFGGRIMWFPPYGLTFNESVQANWNNNDFIGRGEPIYTYTNTVRSGNLGFILLIDHPSILDYWENKGKSVSNGVDSIDDAEQELLRFFAGCDKLTATRTPIPEPDTAIDDDGEILPATRKIKFFVFYPNNYTGINDRPLNAMVYLLNGLGTGKLENGDNYIFFDRTAKNVDGTSCPYGGYETRPGYGVSMGADIKTSSDDKIETIIHNGQQVTLYTINGDRTSQPYQRKWFYRIDKKYQNQLLQVQSYVDSNSYGLNSVFGQPQILSLLGENVGNEKDLFSFADVYTALDESDNSKSVLSGLYDGNKVQELKTIFEKYKVESVSCVGMASVQGYPDLNKELAQNRAETVKLWLASKGKFKADDIKATYRKVKSEETDDVANKMKKISVGINQGNEQWLVNKIYRCAEVTIELALEESKTIQDSQTEAYKSTSASEDVFGGTITSNSTDINDMEKQFKTYISGIKSVRDQVIEKYNWDRADKSFKPDVSEALNKMRMLGRSVEDIVQGQINGFGRTLGIDNATANFMKSTMEEQQEKADVNDETIQSRRYDGESRFFELLGKEEPFLHHKISDKIKYFDPAFHSISPEGFNARLTFLHQCTRQGPTISSSDNNTLNNTANNMSFGRPPVCVLRLGDFYYTKIIINSLQIQFDPLQWDLNHEGIGVMPMMAKVDIGFNFIGGSSLSGYITRLQNAVSFNYYANTEVYDNRSELAEYNENGTVSDFKAFNPY